MLVKMDGKNASPCIGRKSIGFQHRDEAVSGEKGRDYMSDMLHEGIKGYIAIESGIAEIYRCFARMFPQAKDFWNNLGMEEENHAAILTIAAEYERRGKLPVSFASHALSHIEETLAFLNTVRKRIEGEDVSLKEALEVALQLEATTRENHLQEVKANETNSIILAGLRNLAIDNEWHVQKIDSFLRSSGL